MPGDTRDYSAMVRPVTSAQVGSAWVVEGGKSSMGTDTYTDAVVRLT
jgi:hypothetical protein